MSSSIVQQAAGVGMLNINPEHYQTFEIAKANDDVLGGTDIAKIRTLQARTRAEAQAIYKMMSEMERIEDVAVSKSELLETSQLLAKYSVYGDQRIGEILRELPTKQGARTDTTSVTAGTEVTKRQAEQQAGISHKQSIDLQTMAANPEVVEAVIAKAEAEGRIVSRSQVLKAIKERDEARDELESLRSAEPEVIEREVESKEAQKRIHDLEHLERIHCKDNQTLRRHLEETRNELDRARSILGLDETTREVQRDVQYLVTSTNQYVRHYGGLTWTVQSLSDVDCETLEELRKAVRNLVTFANTLMTCLEEING